jgi:DNA-binding LacI/PurR family transcriptional regulator
MITIKDIAIKTGTSQSTVSIVLNGKAKERKISPKTEESIMAAVKELGYRPNLSARLLRENKLVHKFYVIVFWTSDYRESALTSFLQGLHSAIQKNGFPCEIIIKPYICGYLCDAMSEDILRIGDGCIICHASPKDLDYLESNDIQKPVVLCDRTSRKYSSVILEYNKIGRVVAEIFSRHSRKKLAVISEPLLFEGIEQMTDSFEKELKKLGIDSYMAHYTDTSISNGYKSMNSILEKFGLPDCLYCTSNLLAFGAIRALYEKNFQIPQDIEIIAGGIGDMEQEKYGIPSLSILHVPLDKFASKCLNILYDHITYANTKPISAKVSYKYYARESCGE